jgi:hypothetical protein
MTAEPDPGKVAGQQARTRRLRPTWLLLATSLGVAPVLAACSGPAGHAGSLQTAPSAAISAVCTQVGAALSDGPDPDADPVGYAEAQVGPLRAIRTSDPALRSAIRGLATAYASVFAHDGKDQSATRAVGAASKRLNAICPGSAS